MFVYNIYWDAGKSILLYPMTYEIVERFGLYHKGRMGDNKCKIGFISVLDKNGYLNMDLGKEILKKIN